MPVPPHEPGSQMTLGRTEDGRLPHSHSLEPAPAALRPESENWESRRQACTQPQACPRRGAPGCIRYARPDCSRS